MEKRLRGERGNGHKWDGGNGPMDDGGKGSQGGTYGMIPRENERNGPTQMNQGQRSHGEWANGPRANKGYGHRGTGRTVPGGTWGGNGPRGLKNGARGGQANGIAIDICSAPLLR